MKKLISNCPNCGAPLRHDGFCEYCNTKIRYENEIDIFDKDLFKGNDIEILLKISTKKYTKLIPLKGHIGSITTRGDQEAFYYDDTPIMIMADPEYEIVFVGHIDKEEIGVEGY